jgi:hypothetical protein
MKVCHVRVRIRLFVGECCMNDDPEQPACLRQVEKEMTHLPHPARKSWVALKALLA